MKIKYICISLFLFISLSLYAQKKIVILHTNDTHSRIEPLPSTDKDYPNRAGVVNREALIEQIRKENPNVLLFDAGDFVQGTPYFNLFKGKVETSAMNLMKYDAGTIGNHEFDYGLPEMKKMIENLKFPIVNCNYDFSETELKGMIQPYIILKKFGLKIGVLGVGVDPEGLIQKDKYEGMDFKPIIPTVNYYATKLKKEEKCDIIICLSHIGYADDIILAQQSQYVDIILGGHSHTYMEKPDMRKNLDNKDVMIFQLGKSAAFLGKVDVELDKIK